MQEEIDERRRTENALKESEATNRALLDAIPDLMFRIHKDGTYLDYQAREEDLYLMPEEFIGKK